MNDIGHDAAETQRLTLALLLALGLHAALLLGIPRQTFNYRYRRLMRAQNRRNPAKTETGKA